MIFYLVQVWGEESWSGDMCFFGSSQVVKPLTDSNSSFSFFRSRDTSIISFYRVGQFLGCVKWILNRVWSHGDFFKSGFLVIFSHIFSLWTSYRSPNYEKETWGTKFAYSPLSFIHFCLGCTYPSSILGSRWPCVTHACDWHLLQHAVEVGDIAVPVLLCRYCRISLK